MASNLIDRLNKFPPFLCRFVARDKSGQKPISNIEISRRTGISVVTIAKISRMRSWDNLKLSTIQSFSNACGVNLLSTSEQRRFLRRRKKIYAKKAWRLYRGFLPRLGHNDPA